MAWRRRCVPSFLGIMDDRLMETLACLSTQASRWAAAVFFSELLVFRTCDRIKLTEPESFSNIEVRTKDQLWARRHHRSMVSSLPNGFPRMS